MHSGLTKKIVDFKLQNAETLAWLYDFSRTQNEKMSEARQDIIQFCKTLDLAEPAKSGDKTEAKLVEFIRRTRGIKPADNEILSFESIFPRDASALSFLDKAAKFINVDLGDIEELFEKVIASITAIREYLTTYYKDILKLGSGILEKIDIILEALKNLKSDTHLLIHVQTRLEMSQLQTQVA